MRAALAATAAALLLISCGEREAILPGERLALRAEPGLAPDLELGPRPISLAAPRDVAAWTHTNGTPEHRVVHPALPGPRGVAWAAPIGVGDTRRHRITATPVVAADGRVFTLDALAGVAAHDRAGRRLWFADLTPAGERPTDASGGGLALEGGSLYVTTAFGRLSALDAATGRVRWEQRLGAAATGTPTVRDGVVYAVSRDGTGWAVEADTGRVAWQVLGLPDAAGFVGPAGPAVSERLAVFPFSSGEVLAVFRRGGAQAWRASVRGDRVGRASAVFDDVTGDPVFADGRVYVGNATGRVAAFDPDTGERLWTAREGAMGPVWPAGGSLFLVSDASALVRLDAATGSAVWRAELPGFVRERPSRQRDVHAHHGPVLAGGRLWVASTDGFLRAFDPRDGRLVGALAVPGGASTAPVVAGRTLFLVTTEGRLLAYR